MIGKREWFARRKYSGWGLTPKTWQGFAYVAVIVLLIAAVTSLPISNNVKTAVTAVFVTIIVVDILHIMATIKLDEREAKIEAIAERNASWTMVATLAFLLFYFSTNNATLTSNAVMPFILVPMITGMVAKTVSSLILQNKEL